MIALDTNVVVRLIVADDVVQLGRARGLLRRSPVLVQTTVLLETEWVLRKTYSLTRQQVHAALSLFCGLPEVQLEDVRVVRDALDLLSKGFDFADAVHVVALPSRVPLATFDKSLLKLSAKHLVGDAVIEPDD